MALSYLPDHQAVGLAQAFALTQIGRTGLMQTKDTGHTAQEQQGQEHVAAETAVGHDQVAGFELIEQFLQEAQFVLVLVAFGVIEQGASGQTEDAHQLQERKTTTGFLLAGLGISPLVFLGVRQTSAGAVDEFDPPAVPELAGLLGGGGDPYA
jgi:hypothetical protein